MRHFLLLLLGCTGWQLVSGQQAPRVIERVILDDSRSPIIWIDSMKTDINHLVIDRSDIDSFRILRDSSGVSGYGKDALKGVLLVSPKEGVKMLRLAALLEQQGVPAADRALRVCVNKNLVRYPAFLLIDPAYVKTIEITSNRHWNYIEDANSNELFLNIITRDSALPLF